MFSDLVNKRRFFSNSDGKERRQVMMPLPSMARRIFEQFVFQNKNGRSTFCCVWSCVKPLIMSCVSKTKSQEKRKGQSLEASRLFCFLRVDGALAMKTRLLNSNPSSPSSGEEDDGDIYDHGSQMVSELSQHIVILGVVVHLLNSLPWHCGSEDGIVALRMQAK